MAVQVIESHLREATLARVRRRLVTDQVTGCWIWTGARNHGGYGVCGVTLARRMTRQFRVHRLVYELLVGPIPDGLTIDHLCRTAACANPAHLEPVTASENSIRQNRSIVACKWGHPFDETNTGYQKLRSGLPRRMCKQCHREKALARYHATKALKSKVPRTHCGRGHELNVSNVYLHHGSRICRACNRETYHERKRA